MAEGPVEAEPERRSREAGHHRGGGGEKGWLGLGHGLPALLAEMAPQLGL
jgi:hypothetical protein